MYDLTLIRIVGHSVLAVNITKPFDLWLAKETFLATECKSFILEDCEDFL